MRIGFDFDGVLCLTPFGRFAVHAPEAAEAIAEPPPDAAQLYEAPASHGPLRLAFEWLRFAWRTPAPDARDVLLRLAAAHELHIVTGRSDAGRPIVERWLRREGLGACFTRVWMAPPGVSSPQHKLAVARIAGIDAHIDDDPRTAWYLARHGVKRVWLLDHADARGEAPLPPGVELLPALAALPEAIGA